MQNVLWECVLASLTRSQVETLDVKICVRFLTHPRCLCTVRHFLLAKLKFDTFFMVLQGFVLLKYGK